MVAAMLTLYSFTPCVELTMLLSCTVIGKFLVPAKITPKQEVVPDAGDLQDHGHHENGQGHRQHDLQEDAPEARAPSTRAALKSSGGSETK